MLNNLKQALAGKNENEARTLADLCRLVLVNLRRLKNGAGGAFGTLRSVNVLKLAGVFPVDREAAHLKAKELEAELVKFIPSIEVYVVSKLVKLDMPWEKMKHEWCGCKTYGADFDWGTIRLGKRCHLHSGSGFDGYIITLTNGARIMAEGMTGLHHEFPGIERILEKLAGIVTAKGVLQPSDKASLTLLVKENKDELESVLKSNFYPSKLQWSFHRLLQ